MIDPVAIEEPDTRISYHHPNHKSRPLNQPMCQQNFKHEKMMYILKNLYTNTIKSHGTSHFHSHNTSGSFQGAYDFTFP